MGIKEPAGRAAANKSKQSSMNKSSLPPTHNTTKQEIARLGTVLNKKEARNEVRISTDSKNQPNLKNASAFLVPDAVNVNAV
jgi:hypothetical protein